MDFKFSLNDKGYLKQRESVDLEYKENFSKGDSLFKYIKTMVGMANNRGGKIVFGVKDSPHIPVGMSNDRFMSTDPKDIDARIREHFEPSIQWTMDICEFGGKSFGVISIQEAVEKPIVCKRQKDNMLREGAIYYRYRGETKEIEYAELKKLLDVEKEKERLLWMKHIEKIRMVGPRNIEILDLFNGELSYGERKIVLEDSLLDKLNVIKEGSFTEKEGEGIPVLKLIGEIEGLVNSDEVVVNPETMYPMTTKQLQCRLNLNQTQMWAIIYHLGLKSKPEYHAEISVGKSAIHKYTEKAEAFIREALGRGKEEFIRECMVAYNTRPRTLKAK